MLVKYYHVGINIYFDDFNNGSCCFKKDECHEYSIYDTNIENHLKYFWDHE